MGETLARRGAIIFSGGRLADAHDFDQIVKLLVRPGRDFDEETSPRSALSEVSYTSTDYPAQYPIQFHNEFSYRASRPDVLLFGCLVAPLAQGSTPIADGRLVLERLPRELVDRFADGVQYVRNYVGMGIDWQTAFGTDAKDEVEAYCEQAGLAYRWSADGLHTAQRGEVTVRHPITDELSWCNHVINFSVHGVQPAEVRSALVAADPSWRPTDTLYADGTSVDVQTIEAIRAAYEAVAYRHPWQSGDVMVLDNLLTAHARDPYTGQRKIVVGMGARRD